MNKKIKVLSIGSFGKRNQMSPIRYEQGESLRKKGIEVDYFNIKGRGIFGYFKSYINLKKKLKSNYFDLIHAHYGLSGFISTLQRKIPVIITFHGSDVWQQHIRYISLIASYLTKWNIFISDYIQNHAKRFRKTNCSIIPCGIDLEEFYPIDKMQARTQLDLNKDEKYVLFSSSFSKKVKNYPLAKQAMAYVPSANLIELKGYSREEVNLLMNASDALLVTSYKESGPLVVKEAMACNLPIVSTKVGDVKEVIGNTKGCYLSSYESKDVGKKLKMALNFTKQTSGRRNVQKYELSIIAERIISLYRKIILM